MYFSFIRLRRDVSPKDLAAVGQGDGYRVHKLLWNLFSDGPERKRDFLYRYETVKGWPTFYTVSARKPYDRQGLWEIMVKDYYPRLVERDRLSFKLRVNPTHRDKKERTEEEIEVWLGSREQRGLKQKTPTKKRIRHDVVMDAKKRIGFRDISHDQRPHVASLIQEAGLTWLKGREMENGFSVNERDVRADGYYQHRLFKREGGKRIVFSSLDFDGILSVTDRDKFVEKCLYHGIGASKGFGCGLMLVRRV
jgi:CRISPR system Cascade subunit CasE